MGVKFASLGLLREIAAQMVSRAGPDCVLTLDSYHALILSLVSMSLCQAFWSFFGTSLKPCHSPSNHALEIAPP